MPRGISGWAVGMTKRSSYLAIDSSRYISLTFSGVMPTEAGISSFVGLSTNTSRM